jgi:hypothetical protein
MVPPARPERFFVWEMKIIFQFFCADHMTSFFVIGKALEFLEASSIIVLLLWTLRLHSLRSVFKRYPIRVRFWWVVPFTPRWRQIIDSRDIDSVRRFRNNFFAMESLLLISTAVKIGYFNWLGIRLLFMMARGQCRS